MTSDRFNIMFRSLNGQTICTGAFQRRQNATSFNNSSRFCPNWSSTCYHTWSTFGADFFFRTKSRATCTTLWLVITAASSGFQEMQLFRNRRRISLYGMSFFNGGATMPYSHPSPCYPLDPGPSGWPSPRVDEGFERQPQEFQDQPHFSGTRNWLTFFNRFFNMLKPQKRLEDGLCNIQLWWPLGHSPWSSFEVPLPGRWSRCGEGGNRPGQNDPFVGPKKDVSHVRQKPKEVLACRLSLSVPIPLCSWHDKWCRLPMGCGSESVTPFIQKQRRQTNLLEQAIYVI